jgi:hypothetical protein
VAGLTITQTVQLVAIGLFLGLGLAMWRGIRLLASARELRFYSLRRERVSLGWRLILLSVGLGLAGLSVQFLGTRAVFAVIVPTPSLTPSPVPSLTPTITLTPSVTLTPLASNTPTITPTPSIPEELSLTFNDTVTPDANAAFSPILIAPRIDLSNRPLGPAEAFRAPPRRLYGAFTYNNLRDGERWTALWYLGDQRICSESKPWDGGTGGYGYTECAPLEGWLPGEYEIQMFLGETWKVSARFTIESIPATKTPVPGLTPSTGPG